MGSRARARLLANTCTRDGIFVAASAETSQQFLGQKPKYFYQTAGLDHTAVMAMFEAGIKKDGVLVGGIGVGSGAPGDDLAVGHAALQAIGADAQNGGNCVPKA